MQVLKNLKLHSDCAIAFEIAKTLLWLYRGTDSDYCLRVTTHKTPFVLPLLDLWACTPANLKPPNELFGKFLSLQSFHCFCFLVATFCGTCFVYAGSAVMQTLFHKKEKDPLYSAHPASPAPHKHKTWAQQVDADKPPDSLIDNSQRKDVWKKKNIGAQESTP